MLVEGLFDGVVGMEVTLRGMLEKEIESFTSPEVLRDMILRFQERFPMKSMEDCLFGFTVGSIKELTF